MSLLKRMFSRTVTGTPQSAGASPQADYVGMVKGIIRGDKDAEAQLVTCFGPGVFQIILSIVRNRSLAEDFSQDALIIIIEKIRAADLKQPESLKYFVSSVARFHAIGQMRSARRRDQTEDLEHVKKLKDPTPNRLEELQTLEQSRDIREVMEDLVPRYRELLLRFYINEESKEDICADLGLTSTQFDGVLHRARKRYRALYLKRKERADQTGR